MFTTRVFLVLALMLPAALAAQTPQQLREQRFHNDWADLARFREANAALPAPAPGEPRVVFMGNSITEVWAKYFPAHFTGRPYIGRGISGQTTPQMLVRFRQDVVALRPRVVVILAGTNDIAGNTGPATLEMIGDNIASMTELAQAHGIRVVLGSVLPVFDYPWKPGLAPAPKILALNAWLRQYAAKAGAVYVDFHTPMADGRNGLKPELSPDGVHPNEAGYRVMAPLVEQGIAAALSAPTLADTDSAAVRELIALEQHLNDLLNRRDWRSYAPYVADDYRQTTRRGEVRSKRDVLEALQRATDERREMTSPDSIQARVYGDTGVLTAVLTGTRADGSITFRSRILKTFVRRNGRWYLVAMQGTPLP